MLKSLISLLYCIDFLVHSPTICYCPRRRIARKSCSSRRPASLTSPAEITNTYCQKNPRKPQYFNSYGTIVAYSLHPRNAQKLTIVSFLIKSLLYC